MYPRPPAYLSPRQKDKMRERITPADAPLPTQQAWAAVETPRAGFTRIEPAIDIRELVAGHPTLSTVAEALLAARGTLFGQWQQLEKRLRSLAREDARVRLLMTAPGVGAIVGLTYAAAIDDPSRFRSSKTVGAHFGLTPKKYQSGETDITGRISKIGDGGVRTALYEAANVILTRPVKGSTLKSWGMRLAARAGMRKAARSCPQARRGSASYAGRRHHLPRRQSGRGCSPLTKGDYRFGRFQTSARPEQGPVAGTMDQVRPMTFQQSFATARRFDGVEIALGCRKQVVALTHAFGGQVGIAADDEAFAGEVRRGDDRHVALIEQCELQPPTLGQGLDIRRAQRGDPVEIGRDHVVADAGLG